MALTKTLRHFTSQKWKPPSVNANSDYRVRTKAKNRAKYCDAFKLVKFRVSAMKAGWISPNNKRGTKDPLRLRKQTVLSIAQNLRLKASQNAKCILRRFHKNSTFKNVKGRRSIIFAYLIIVNWLGGIRLLLSIKVGRQAATSPPRMAGK